MFTEHECLLGNPTTTQEHNLMYYVSIESARSHTSTNRGNRVVFDNRGSLARVLHPNLTTATEFDILFCSGSYWHLTRPPLSWSMCPLSLQIVYGIYSVDGTGETSGFAPQYFGCIDSSPLNADEVCRSIDTSIKGIDASSCVLCKDRLERWVHL